MSSPETMRALVQTAYGKPSKVLAIQHLPKPVLSPESSDLLVRIKCASMSPVEYTFFSGLTRILGVFTLPAVSGLDFSGMVERVGSGAEAQGWKEGDEVLGGVPIGRKGTYQEYILLPCTYCVRRPPNLSWEEACSIPETALTALQALQKHKGGTEAAFVTGGRASCSS